MEKLLQRISNLDRTAIICSPDIRRELKRKLAEKKLFIDVVFRSFHECAFELVGSYRPEARIKLAKEEKISPEYAQILLKNSLVVSDRYQNQKIYELLKIRKNYENYLDKNPFAINKYKNRIVFIINDPNTDDLFSKAREILKKETAIIDYAVANAYKKEINLLRFPSEKAEIEWLAKEVATLIEKGVSPEKIRIHQIPNEYRPYLKEVFSLTDIDIDDCERPRFFEYEFLKQTLIKLKSCFDLPIDCGFQRVLDTVSLHNPLYYPLTMLFNSYMGIKGTIRDIYEDLKYQAKMISPKIIGYEHCIRIENLLESAVEKDDYVFILGFNQDIFPRIIRDEDYLSDHEKAKLGLATSLQKNHREKDKCLHLINSSKHLYLSYPITDSSGRRIRSGLYYELEKIYPIREIEYQEEPVSYSEKLDRLKLGKKLDLFYKYDETDEELFSLYNQYQDIGYKAYSHKFKINPAFSKRMEMKLSSFSYTAIDQYYRCGYLFYLEKILNISRPANEDGLYIGTLFHECLHKLLKEPDIADIGEFLNQTINGYLQSIGKTPTKKETFFIEKYKEVLIRWYQETKKHSEVCEFSIFGLEKEFKISKGFDLVGKIDKILTASIGGENYAIVIDYKSGHIDFDLNRIIYGLNMQILFYFYFLNQFSKETYHFAGGYLQPILPNMFSYEKEMTLEDHYRKHFQWKGYSNPAVLKKIDRNYEGESFISGMRVKQDGSFYAYTEAKLIKEEQFWKLLKVVEEKIETACQRIANGEFLINPKKLGTLDSCEFCPYKDLCFRDDSDYEELKKHANFDFLEEKQ